MVNGTERRRTPVQAARPRSKAAILTTEANEEVSVPRVRVKAIARPPRAGSMATALADQGDDVSQTIVRGRAGSIDQSVTEEARPKTIVKARARVRPTADEEPTAPPQRTMVRAKVRQPSQQTTTKARVRARSRGEVEKTPEPVAIPPKPKAGARARSRGEEVEPVVVPKTKPKPVIRPRVAPSPKTTTTKRPLIVGRGGAVARASSAAGRKGGLILSRRPLPPPPTQDSEEESEEAEAPRAAARPKVVRGPRKPKVDEDGNPIPPKPRAHRAPKPKVDSEGNPIPPKPRKPKDKVVVAGGPEAPKKRRRNKTSGAVADDGSGGVDRNALTSTYAATLGDLIKALDHEGKSDLILPESEREDVREEPSPVPVKVSQEPVVEVDMTGLPTDEIPGMAPPVGKKRTKQHVKATSSSSSEPKAPARGDNRAWFQRLAEMASADPDTLTYYDNYDYESLTRMVTGLTPDEAVLALIIYGDYLSGIIIAYLANVEDQNVLNDVYLEAVAISVPRGGHPGAMKIIAALEGEAQPSDEDLLLFAAKGGNSDILWSALEGLGLIMDEMGDNVEYDHSPATQGLLNEALILAVDSGCEMCTITLLEVGADPNIDNGALYDEVVAEGWEKVVEAFDAARRGELPVIPSQ